MSSVGTLASRLASSIRFFPLHPLYFRKRENLALANNGRDNHHVLIAEEKLFPSTESP